MLTKLTVGDELPLKLGRKVEKNPQPAPAANALPDLGPALWVSKLGVEGRAMNSDYAHESAPRPIGTIQAKVTTAAQIAAAVEKMWLYFSHCSDDVRL